MGTAFSLFCTVLAAYGLSRRGTLFQRGLLTFVLLTLLFGPGMIPVYLMVKNLGMLNTYWALIIPAAVSAFNLVIIRGFIQGIPSELFDAARIDGASEWRVLWSVVIPLSKAAIAVVGLFLAVGYWNNYFGPLLYLNDSNMWPLQLLMRSFVLQNNITSTSSPLPGAAMPPQQAVQMALVVIATVPILCVVPLPHQAHVQGNAHRRRQGLSSHQRASHPHPDQGVPETMTQQRGSAFGLTTAGLTTAGVSRRTLLKGSLFGAAVAAFGSRVLTACSTGGGAAPAAGGPAVPLPTYVEPVKPPPLLAGNAEGLMDVYGSFPMDGARTVTETVGDGGEFEFLVMTYGQPAPPVEENAYWQTLNEELNLELKPVLVPFADFATKFPALVAADDLPAVVSVPVSMNVSRLPELAAAQFTDLSDHLSGDAVKKYPEPRGHPGVRLAQRVPGRAHLRRAQVRPGLRRPDVHQVGPVRGRGRERAPGVVRRAHRDARRAHRHHRGRVRPGLPDHRLHAADARPAEQVVAAARTARSRPPTSTRSSSRRSRRWPASTRRATSTRTRPPWTRRSATRCSVRPRSP